MQTPAQIIYAYNICITYLHFEEACG